MLCPIRGCCVQFGGFRYAGHEAGHHPGGGCVRVALVLSVVPPRGVLPFGTLNTTPHCQMATTRASTVPALEYVPEGSQYTVGDSLTGGRMHGRRRMTQQHRAVCRRLAMAVAVATLAVTTADTDWAKAVNQNIRVRPQAPPCISWLTVVAMWVSKLFSIFGPRDCTRGESPRFSESRPPPGATWGPTARCPAGAKRAKRVRGPGSLFEKVRDFLTPCPDLPPTLLSTVRRLLLCGWAPVQREPFGSQ